MATEVEGRLRNPSTDVWLRLIDTSLLNYVQEVCDETIASVVISDEARKTESGVRRTSAQEHNPAVRRATDGHGYRSRGGVKRKLADGASQ
jgi:hypothetical protein